MDAKVDNGGGCPVMHGSLTETGKTVTDWWPKTLNLDILHQHDTKSNPLGDDLTISEAVKSAGFRCGERRHEGAAGRQPGLVAGRLRPLRRV
jgi:catalase (peroxidase I)